MVTVALFVAAMALIGSASAATPSGAATADAVERTTAQTLADGQQEECYPAEFGYDGHCEPRPECREPAVGYDGHCEPAPEEDTDGDDRPPEVISFEATYDGSGTVTVTVEFDEKLGGGAVVLTDESGDRIGKGRLTDDVNAAGEVYDTAFSVPADEAENYTARLYEADDRNNNAVQNPGQYSDTAAVTVATPTPEPTATPTATETVTPTAMPTAEPTATPTATPMPTTTESVSTGVAGPEDGSSANAEGSLGSTTTTPPPTTTAAAGVETTAAGATQAAQAAAEPSPTDGGAGNPLNQSIPLLALLLLLAVVIGYVALREA